VSIWSENHIKGLDTGEEPPRIGDSVVAPKVDEEAASAPSSLTCSQCGMPRSEGGQSCHYCRREFIIRPQPLSRPRPSDLPSQNSLDPKFTTKIKFLEQQLEKEPSRISMMLELVEYYLTINKAEQAVQLLEKTPAPQNRMAFLLLLLGKTQESVGAYDQALDAYLAALQEEGWSPEVEEALLRENFLSKTYPQSIERLSEIATEKRDVLVWRLLARVCETKADYDRAAMFLADALRMKPDDVASMSILARLSERRRGMEETEKWHRRILEVNPTIGVSNFFLAHRHYTRGDYAKAIPYFEQLLSKEPNNRIYKLYWSLANVKGHGIHNLETYLAEIAQWHDFTAEQQQLAGELFFVAGQASFQEGKLSQAEQYLLLANQLVPSPQVDRLLEIVAERLVNQSQEGQQNKQIFPSPHERTSADPWVNIWTIILQDSHRRKHQRIMKITATGVRLGLIALLIMGGILGYNKAREWLQSSLAKNKELPRTKPAPHQDVAEATGPTEFLTSETWSVVKPSSDEGTLDSSSSRKTIRKKGERRL